MLEQIIEQTLVKKEIKNNIKSKNIENVKYVIEKELCRVEASKNWDIVVGLVKWGENDSKYEIRKWKKDGIPGKGVTFTEASLKKFIKEIKKIDLSE